MYNQDVLGWSEGCCWLILRDVVRGLKPQHAREMKKATLERKKQFTFFVGWIHRIVLYRVLADEDVGGVEIYISLVVLYVEYVTS